MLLRPNDGHWKLGIIYYNRENPRLLVMKRSGLPWTLNFAKPTAWAITAITVALIVFSAIMNN